VGRPIGRRLAPAQELQAGKHYFWRFSFTVEDGPATSRGYNEKLDWYAWPVLKVVGDPPVPLKAAESEFLLAAGQAGQDSQYRLISKENQASASWASVIVGLLLPVFVLALWVAFFDFPSLKRFIESELLGTVALSVALFSLVWMVVSVQMIYRYLLAELKLGEVSVDITSGSHPNYFQACARGRARGGVTITGCELKLKITEITEVQDGSRSKTERKILWQSRGQTEQRQIIAASELFEAVATVGNLPAGLPVIRENPKIEWTATIRICLQRWPNWQKSYRLHVDD
jgi:hypothetical protein